MQVVSFLSGSLSISTLISPPSGTIYNFVGIHTEEEIVTYNEGKYYLSGHQYLYIMSNTRSRMECHRPPRRAAKDLWWL